MPTVVQQRKLYPSFSVSFPVPLEWEGKWRLHLRWARIKTSLLLLCTARWGERASFFLSLFWDLGCQRLLPGRPLACRIKSAFTHQKPSLQTSGPICQSLDLKPAGLTNARICFGSSSSPLLFTLHSQPIEKKKPCLSESCVWKRWSRYSSAVTPPNSV